MARARIYAVEIPARLVCGWVVIDEKAAAVFLGEDSRESPRRVRQVSDIEQVNDEKIAGLGAFDAERAA